MIRALYSTILRLATPAILLRLLWRSRRAPAYRRRWGERFGYGEAIAGGPIWFHAVSVGETLAAVALIRDVMTRWPEHPLLVTTTTPTGSERVRAAFGDAVHHCYLPYDTPGAVRRFLTRTAPRIGVFMETEIWPNLLAEASARDVPLLLANARLSAESAAGYGRVARLTRETLDRFSLIAAQSEADAGRFRELGAGVERVRVTGSVKFDQPIAEGVVAGGRALRRRLGEQRPVWVAASTHDGEETAALGAHRAVQRRFPTAALIVVPRHPERFDEVAAQIRRSSFRLGRRSEGDRADFAGDVYLGDTMGELPLFLAAADIAFVGGSLVGVGGHNLLEPAALAMPVLTGPAVFNFQQIFELLEAAGGVETVTDAEALGGALSRLFAQPAQRECMGRAAEAVVTANRGAKARLSAAIDELLAAVE